MGFVRCESELKFEMNKEKSKHIDELGKAAPIIRELGFSPNNNMWWDKPDIVLPSIDDKQIGIEVVNYSSHRYEEAEDAIYKILQEYIDTVLDKKTTKRYEIGIFLKNLRIPININYKKQKEQLFKEFDSFLFPNETHLERKYIEDMVAMENPDVEHSFITCDSVVEYEALNESVLLNCIHGKELKLKEYRMRPENQTIQEYYLIVFFPFNEHAELRGYQLPRDFKTSYDRIYLVDFFYINRIK